MMALLDLWGNDRFELESKHVQQVIAFSGDGKLRDGSIGSVEFREYLHHIPSNLLSKYVDDCLQAPFTDSGLALQDIVNEIGRRLDFEVNPGRYRGNSNQPGHDGLWIDTNRYAIVIEVKTTDAYRIDLGTIASYRQVLARSNQLQLDASSMLIIVGRQDTGDLEAQIRGSRYAWDMRVISVDALLHMLKLKEEVEDPSLLKRIHDILIPHEFTRLDPIIEIAFAAVTDVKQEEIEVSHNDRPHKEKKSTPAAFHTECIARVEQHLKTSLLKHSRAMFRTVSTNTRVLCAVSRYHDKDKGFWFAFHPHQKKFLSDSEMALVAFGCGDANTLFLIPFEKFQKWLEHFNKTKLQDRFYWHVKIKKIGKLFMISSRAGTDDIEITKYKI